MSDNPYAITPPVQTQSQLNPYGGFGIFGPPSDPNATGALGMSMGSGYGLLNLGANTVAAANQRTNGGFLANPGVIGALGAGLQTTLAEGQRDAVTRAGLGELQTKTLGEQLANKKAALDYEYQKVRVPWLIQQMQNGSLQDNGTGLPGSPGASSGAGGGQGGGAPTALNVPSEVAGAFRTNEGGSPNASKTGLNQLGFAGNYQLGTAALADAGIYQPAKGEDLSKNQWQGQITIPGYAPMTVAQFLADPKAQDVAFSIHMGNLSKRAHDLGLDSYIGQTIGGVTITPETLAALEHHAGPAGALRFLASNGNFNPADANGVHPSDFAKRVQTNLGAGYKSPPGWFLQTAGNQAPTVGSDGPTTAAPAGNQSPTVGSDSPTTPAGDAGGGQTGDDSLARNLTGERAYQVAQAGGGIQPPPANTGGGTAAPSPGQVQSDVGAIQAGMGHSAQTGQPGTGPQLAQTGPSPYAVHPGETQPPSAPPGYWTPQQAMERARYLRGLAQRQALAGQTEMATGTNQQAQQLEQYAQQQLLEQSKQAQEQTRQQTAPISGRGPGSFSTYLGPDGKIHILQAPIEYEMIAPQGSPDAGRKFRITQNAMEDPNAPYQRPPGVPDWAPRGTLTATQSTLAPGEEAIIKDLSQAITGEKAEHEFDGATNTLRTMEELDAEFQLLNKNPGWYGSGSGANFRLDLSRAINGSLQSAGLPPMFDPAKVAAGEDIVKTSQIAGMSVLTSFFGGNREAASIVQKTQGAVPNLENTPQGAQLLVAGYREGARYVIDRHTFNINWALHHNGNLLGADVAFNQQYAPAAYSRRAISMVRPYELNGEDSKELSRFLPGTHVIFKNDPTHTEHILPGDEDVKLDPSLTANGPTSAPAAAPAATP